MYAFVSTGLTNTWPSRAGFGSVRQRNTVSLEPRLTMTSPTPSRMPATDAAHKTQICQVH